MALSASTVWEVRTTGSDSNGGGFVTGASGTDYSQQDAAQYTATNLVVDGTTNTKVTSASHSFVATDVGNLLQVTAGTGWTTGFYQIVSVASGAATLDRSPAAVSTTGGTFAVGGALASVQKAVTKWTASNRIWVKYNATATTIAAVITDPADVNALPSAPPNFIAGYNATRGDAPAGANRPVIQASATIATSMIQLKTTNVVIENLILDGNNLAATGYSAASKSNPDYGGNVVNTLVKATTSVGIAPVTDTIIACEVTGLKAGAACAIDLGAGGGVIVECEIHDNPCPGFSTRTNYEPFVIEECLIYRNTYGIYIDAGLWHSVIRNNTIAYNSQAGVWVGSTYQQLCLRGNVIAHNSTNGVLATQLGTVASGLWDYNFYYQNTSGNRSGVPKGLHDVDLSAEPFNSASGTANGAADFSLNSTAGGGASVRAANAPAAFPAGLTTAYPDGGAAQHQDSGGGGSSIVVQRPIVANTYALIG